MLELSLAPDLQSTITGISTQLRQWRLLLTVAESCTGGLATACITATPESFTWFDCGFVTYSSASKANVLRVSASTLEVHGSVREPTVAAMATGAIKASRAGIAVAVSGIAGPAGGTPAKPVGLVCLGWYLRPARIATYTHNFSGDRTAIRAETVGTVLRGLLQRLSELPAPA